MPGARSAPSLRRDTSLRAERSRSPRRLGSRRSDDAPRAPRRSCRLPFPGTESEAPMNRSPILFRCDGSAEQGYEAFYQCLVLAAAMQRRRRGTHFLSRLDPLSLALVAHRGGHEWREATASVDTGADVEATLREVRRLQAAAVVVAAPAVGEDYYRELCATGTLVVAIDSTAELTFPNRLVVN